ncbi:MAG TPA: trehalose-6-phosphate synthase [Steroidobacteraceae bacterium]|nr:trehalose-6-phosphate synthase [Steroidobacteraceae bacterium]
MRRLVCVSNRISLPRRGAAAGGLAVGVLAALRHTGGLWFGWSGQTSPEPAECPDVLQRGTVGFATIDLAPAELDAYYNGYCNGTLWPLFHYFPDRFTHEARHHEAYQSINRRFARQLLQLLEPDDVVWVHDYHLIPLGRCLRELGFGGPLGFFLHIPFPHQQMLRLLPDHADLVRDICRYDVAGFQTMDDVDSFLTCVRGEAHPSSSHACRIEFEGRELTAGAYPIGIDVDEVAAEARTAGGGETVRRMAVSLLGRRLIMGVDRLDYTKGLTERFAAFEQFLERFPENQGQVTFLQIAPPSRPDVLAYSEIREALERSAGRLNGRFAEADWTPIRYLNRDYSHPTLMGLLRAADVALVTPIRDGMNLVAKEFVAAQDAADPGVLILSPMAGAARELSGALQVNPYDKTGLASALQTALNMPIHERRRRHQDMLAAVRRHDIHHWYGTFLNDLTGEEIEQPGAADPPGRSPPGALGLRAL